MKKYKQAVIPKVSIPDEWKTKTGKELRDIVHEKLQAIKGKTVINEHLKIIINISGKGLRKTTYGAIMYPKKAALSFCLLELLKHAEYNNWGDKKVKDGLHIIGYLNFKAKCVIDNKVENVHLAVQFQKDGKFHYSMEINKIKIK